MKMKLVASLALMFVLALNQDFCFGQTTQPFQHYWEVCPDLGDIWTKANKPNPSQIDVELLASQDRSTQVRTAQGICSEYANLGAKKQSRAIELLTDELRKQNLPTEVRRGMISALSVLGDGSHAALLWDLAKLDSIARGQVERFLISRKSTVAIEDWRERLKDPFARPTEIASAIKGIMVAGGIEDNTTLEMTLTHQRTTLANRLLAAEALGAINHKGLMDLAQKILSSDIEQGHLMAAKLLVRHRDEGTVSLLLSICKLGPPIAQKEAMRSLSENFPQSAKDIAVDFIQHVDPDLRTMALMLLDQENSDTSLRLQGQLMNDRFVNIRRMVGQQLLRKAEKQRSIVDELVSLHLKGQSWTGIEQAIIVAVQLRDTTRCSELLALLDHPRPEVGLCAGWGLMELATDDATLTEIHQYVAIITEEVSKTKRAQSMTETDYIRISYLNEALGKNRFEPAVPTLMKYVPKNGFVLGKVSRASAIWSLGQLHKGKDNQLFRTSLVERITDFSPNNPEDYLVRFASILALGEMGFDDCKETLRQYNDGANSEIGQACSWALKEIERSSVRLR